MKITKIAQQQEQEKEREREYPVAAVVVADGIIFEGRTHGEAIQKGRDEGHIHTNEDGYLIDSEGNDMAFSGATDLFRTNKDRYINRFQALDLGEAVGAENIPKQEYDVREDPYTVQKDTTTPALSTISTPVAPSAGIPTTPRQIYTRDDIIQNREDLAPSMLRKRKKK